MKKFMALILAMAMAMTLLLTGCGGSSSGTTAAPAASAAASAAGSAAASAAGSGDASGDPKVSFSVNNTHSGEGVQDKSMDMLIDLCNKYSGGSIQGTKIAGGSLGGEREITEMIQLGTLECGFISDMGIDSAIGGLDWAWLPFMITSYDQVDQYYINGWIGEELTKEMGAQGIVRVAATENEFREVGNVKKEIASMADFKGLKIRVPEVTACQDFYNACGAIPASISTSETLAALEQGTVDGVDNSIYNMKSMGVLEDIKYITLLNYMYSGASIVCSEDFWNSMTDAQKAAFTKAATETGEYFRKTMREETQTILSQGSFKVTEVAEDSQFYKDLKAAAVQLWQQYSSKYDSTIMDQINKDFGAKS
jgi:TRAP-type C4-dicarboxylate transport system substrate-binding protein